MKADVVLLSKEHLATLKDSDTFETEGVFQGLSDAKVKWFLSNILKEKKEVAYVFEVSYMGIHMGNYVATVKPNGQVEVGEDV
jgi:hypothetical protein